MNPYETLDVPKTASEEDIKRAYQRKAQQHHPDRSNGNNEAFLKVKQSYDILRNPVRRKTYDEVGKDMYLSAEEAEKRAEGEIINLFNNIIEKLTESNDENLNPIDNMIMLVKNSISNAKCEKIRLENKSKKLAKITKRVKKKNPKGNILLYVLQQKKENLINAMFNVDCNIKISECMVLILSDYEYLTEVFNRENLIEATKPMLVFSLAS